MSNTVTWVIEPIDTWFFRQGSPFDLGQNVLTGDVIFPPHMSTLQGAIRTAIAREQGWHNGHDDLWPEILGTPDDLGAMSLEGVFLQKNHQLLFPVPRHLVQYGEAIISLTPGDPVESDLGLRALPRLKSGAPQEGKVSSLDESYISSEGLVQSLQGKLPPPETILSPDTLWHQEIRTGLGVNDQTQVAEPGLLYQATHVRLKKDVSLIVSVKGIPWTWQKSVRAFPLGGESRFARATLSEHSISLPPLTVKPSHDGQVRVIAILLTPGLFEDPQRALRDGPLSEPCLSAVTGRVARRGGWDLKRRRPRPSDSFIPAGSVWFYLLSPKTWDTLKILHGRHVGMKTEYGFGHIIFGQWEE